jgi:hypothetical protein
MYFLPSARVPISRSINLHLLNAVSTDKPVVDVRFLAATDTATKQSHATHAHAHAQEYTTPVPRLLSLGEDRAVQVGVITFAFTNYYLPMLSNTHP